VLDKN